MVYVGLPFVAAVSYILYKETMDLLGYLGSAVIVGCAITVVISKEDDQDGTTSARLGHCRSEYEPVEQAEEMALQNHR